MSETVKLWIKDFNKGDITVEEEIDNIKGTISNEILCVKGSLLEVEAMMHKENIELLKEYLYWLEHVAQ